MPKRPPLSRDTTATLVPTEDPDRLAVATDTRTRGTQNPTGPDLLVAPDNTPEALRVCIAVGTSGGDAVRVVAGGRLSSGDPRYAVLGRAGAQQLHQILGRALDRAGVPTLAVNVEDLDAAPGTVEADVSAVEYAAAAEATGYERARTDLLHGLPSAELHRAALHYADTRPTARPTDPPSAAAWDDDGPTPDPSSWAANLERIPGALVAAMRELLTHPDDAVHRLGALAAVRTIPGPDLEPGDALEAARFLSTGLLPGETITTTEEAPRG